MLAARFHQDKYIDLSRYVNTYTTGARAENEGPWAGEADNTNAEQAAGSGGREFLTAFCRGIDRISENRLQVTPFHDCQRGLGRPPGRGHFAPQFGSRIVTIGQ